MTFLSEVFQYLHFFLFSLRIENLELLSQYGSAAWKVHNETLTRILAQQQKKLMDIKKEIQEINWKRKTEQVRFN